MPGEPSRSGRGSSPERPAHWIQGYYHEGWIVGGNGIHYVIVLLADPVKVVRS